MAQNKDKKTFIMYHDWETFFNSLENNAEAGQLIKALFAFAKRGEITEFTGALKLAFVFMSEQIIKDGEKWEEIREVKQEAARKRWSLQNNANNADVCTSMHMHTNDTDVCTCMQNLQEYANDAVNVNVNVNDNVNVNGNVNDNVINNLSLKEKEKKEKMSDHEKILTQYTDNSDLQQSIRDFIKHRKAIKSPMTDKALTLLLNNLDKLAKTDENKIAVLNQSIERGWKTVYPIKDITTEETAASTDIDEYKSVINKFLY